MKSSLTMWMETGFKEVRTNTTISKATTDTSNKTSSFDII